MEWPNLDPYTFIWKNIHSYREMLKRTLMKEILDPMSLLLIKARNLCSISQLTSLTKSLARLYLIWRLFRSRLRNCTLKITFHGQRWSPFQYIAKTLLNASCPAPRHREPWNLVQNTRTRSLPRLSK